MSGKTLRIPVARVGITRPFHRVLVGVGLLLVGTAILVTLPVVVGPLGLGQGFGVARLGALSVLFTLSVLVPIQLEERVGSLQVEPDRLVVRRGNERRRLPRQQMLLGWVFDSAHGPRFAIELSTGEVVSAVLPSEALAQSVLDTLGLGSGPLDLRLSAGSRLRVGSSALEVLGRCARRIAYADVHDVETCSGGLVVVTTAGDRVSVPLLGTRPRALELLGSVGDVFLPAAASVESESERIEAVAERVRSALRRWRQAELAARQVQRKRVDEQGGERSVRGAHRYSARTASL